MVRAAALILALLASCAPAYAEQHPCDTLPKAAIDHIIRWEVGSQAAYTKRYTRPVCPACLSTASGVTIGVGYDLGHVAPAPILRDWRQHPQRDRLPPASGLGGQRAIDMTAGMQDVVTPWPLALDVFEATSLHDYCRRTLRAYPGIERLPPMALGVMTATTFNRGTATQGHRRRHLKAIRDACVPLHELAAMACIADQLQASTELWANTAAANGLRNRYTDAARLARTPP